MAIGFAPKIHPKLVGPSGPSSKLEAQGINLSGLLNNPKATLKRKDAFTQTQDGRCAINERIRTMLPKFSLFSCGTLARMAIIKNTRKGGPPMEHDPKIVLALAAVQLMGGKSVVATDEPIKSVKKFFKEIEEFGFLAKNKIKIPSTTKAGKPSTKSVETYDLTNKGNEFLRKVGSLESIAAVVNVGFLTSFRESLEADRRKLCEQVQATVEEQANNDNSAKKALEGLTKKVADIAKRLEKLERPADVSTIDNQIERGFTDISDRLEQAIQRLTMSTEATDAARSVIVEVNNEASGESPEFRELQTLSMQWSEATNDDAKIALEDQMRNRGATLIGNKGDVIDFNGDRHRCQGMILPGMKVEVIQEGWELHQRKQSTVLLKATVEAVSD